MGSGNRYNLISMSRYSVYGYEYDRQRDNSKDAGRTGRGKGHWMVVTCFNFRCTKRFSARSKRVEIIVSKSFITSTNA